MSVRVIRGALSVAALAAVAVLGSAPTASAETCTIDDSPNATQTGPGQFTIDLRTQVTCFGTPVTIED